MRLSLVLLLQSVIIFLLSDPYDILPNGVYLLTVRQFGLSVAFLQRLLLIPVFVSFVTVEQ